MAIKLVCYDVDGTLLHHPDGGHFWDNLYKRTSAGIEQRDEWRTAFRRGELSYDDWINKTVDLLRNEGFGREAFYALARELTFVTGAYETLSAVEHAGIDQAIISETVDVVVAAHLSGFRFAAVHTLGTIFDDKGYLQEIRASPYHEQSKVDGVQKVADSLSIPLSDVAFLGDGLNDRWALSCCYGIAVRPEHQDVASAAKKVVHDVRDALPLILGR